MLLTGGNDKFFSVIVFFQFYFWSAYVFVQSSVFKSKPVKNFRILQHFSLGRCHIYLHIYFILLYFCRSVIPLKRSRIYRKREVFVNVFVFVNLELFFFFSASISIQYDGIPNISVYHNMEVKNYIRCSEKLWFHKGIPYAFVCLIFQRGNSDHTILISIGGNFVCNAGHICSARNDHPTVICLNLC